MTRKIVKAFSLSFDVMRRIDTLTDRLRLEPELGRRLGFVALSGPNLTPDKRGLVHADYDELRKLAGSSLSDGDGLLDHVLLQPATRSQASKIVRCAQKRNAQLQSKYRASQRTFNLSKTVEALLMLALGSLEADAALISTKLVGSKSRHAEKAA